MKENVFFKHSDSTHRDDIRFEVTDVALAYGVVREAAAGYALKGMR